MAKDSNSDSVNQSEIINLIHAKHRKEGIARWQIENSLVAINREIANSLANGDRVEIRGFGTFFLRERKSRIVKNPRSGKDFTVPERRIPRFKPGKRLKENVDNNSNRKKT